MRREDREITDYDKMLEIMGQCDCCRLGLRDGDGVYIVPLNFGYQATGGRAVLYFHGACEGKKMDLIRAQPHVGFEMDTGHRLIEGAKACAYSYSYRSIIGRGDASLVSDYGEKIAALQCIMSHYGSRTDWTFDSGAVRGTAIIRLAVTEWTCKERL